MSVTGVTVSVHIFVLGSCLWFLLDTFTFNFKTSNENDNEKNKYCLKTYHCSVYGMH